MFYDNEDIGRYLTYSIDNVLVNYSVLNKRMIVALVFTWQVMLPPLPHEWQQYQTLVLGYRFVTSNNLSTA
jgi:hypothetical protein